MSIAMIVALNGVGFGAWAVAMMGAAPIIAEQSDSINGSPSPRFHLRQPFQMPLADDDDEVMAAVNDALGLLEAFNFADTIWT